MNPPDPRDAVFDVSDMDAGMGARVGRSSIQVLGLSVAKVFLLFGGIAIIARLIPPAEYGIFALAMPAVAVAVSLSNFGLPQAIVQRQTLSHAEASTLFWLNLAFATCAALVFVALSEPIARLLRQPEVALVYRALAISILLAAVVGQFNAIMRRRLRTAGFELLALCGEAAGLAVAITTALMGLSYWALVAQQITVQAVTLVLVMRAVRWLPSGPQHIRIGPIKGALHFGGYVAGVGILNKLIGYVGTTIIGAQLGPAAAGLYQRALRLGNLPPLRIMQPLSGTFVPAFSRLQDDPTGLRALYERLISRANLMLLPAAVIMAAGAEPIVGLLLGPDWMEATPLLFWMSLLTLRAGANHGLRYAMLASGHSKELFFNTIFRFVLISAVLYMVSDYGLVAMTAAYMLTELFITLPVLLWQALRLTALDFATVQRASLRGMVFAVLLAAGLILGINPWLESLPAVLHLGALCALTGVAYAGLVALTPSLHADVGTALRKITTRLPGRSSA